LCIAKESNKKPAAKAIASHVGKVEKNIIEVSNIKVEVGDVAAENAVETKVGDVSEDRLNLSRLKECLDRYEAVAVAKKALGSQVINALKDDEVYNKRCKNGKMKHYKN